MSKKNEVCPYCGRKRKPDIHPTACNACVREVVKREFTMFQVAFDSWLSKRVGLTEEKQKRINKREEQKKEKVRRVEVALTRELEAMPPALRAAQASWPEAWRQFALVLENNRELLRAEIPVWTVRTLRFCIPKKVVDECRRVPVLPDAHSPTSILFNFANFASYQRTNMPVFEVAREFEATWSANSIGQRVVNLMRFVAEREGRVSVVNLPIAPEVPYSANRQRLEQFLDSFFGKVDEPMTTNLPSPGAT